MAIIGAVDSMFDMAGPRARAAFKTVLGSLGILINIKNFSAGRFENEAHLRAYLAALVAATVFGLHNSRRRISANA